MRLKRVSPTCVLGTLLISSLIFLLIQFNLVPLFGRYEGEETQSSKARVTKKQNSLQFDAVSKFSKLLINFHISGFLIDSEVLRSILKLQDGSPFLSNYCTVLCTSRSASSQFGVISHVDISEKFLEGAKEAGFSHFEVTGQDPRVLSRNASKKHDIPYHHFFVYKSHLIQLVVFYVRSNRYLWHSRINWSQVSPLLEGWRDDQTLYGSRGEGAYDMMEFAEVKVDNVYFMVPKYPQKFLDQVQHSTFLECNYDRAAKFVSRQYDGGDEDESAEMFRSNAKDILIAAANVLDELRIPFWLSSGTCLSWFRECRIIGHSLDVDLGMKITDYNVQLIPAMEVAGLMLVHRFGKESDSFELSFVKDQLKLDIFFFYEEGETLWNGGTDTNTGEKFKYVFPWFDLCWTEFVGIKVRVPCQTLSYVEANYGKSWNTKVTSWDWKSSPPNVVPNGHWQKEEWLEVMQVFDIIEVEET